MICRSLAAVLTAALATMVAPPAMADTAAGAGPCQPVDVPVTIDTGQPQTMHGTLCLPPDGNPRTIQVLVPGATYDHRYWDFGYQPERYNFRKAMNEAGYATFVVDRLGTGLSSRPLSTRLTAATQAAAVHQVIGALRTGEAGGITFPTVILGGHSLGSMIAVVEAATYHDADAVLITGLTHLPSATGFPGAAADLRPAILDPALADDGYDPGYLTTATGSRAQMFYTPETMDPRVLALDEETKTVAAATEFSDGLLLGSFTPYTDLIDAPVMVADGERDYIFCGGNVGGCEDSASLMALEKPSYAHAACLDTFVLPSAGHSINLATNTGAYQDAVLRWADTMVGTGAEPVPDPQAACRHWPEEGSPGHSPPSQR
jgi:pimeloyl-ACP methyl ester carboxylesterase